MAVFRYPRDVTTSNMNAALAGAEDLERSLRPKMHEFKKMLVAIKVRFTRVMATGGKNQCLLNGGGLSKHFDGEYLGPVAGQTEDPREYDERRKAQLMTWIQDL